MRFEQKLKHMDHDKIWSEYCGFLDLDFVDYGEDVFDQETVQHLSLYEACATISGRGVSASVFAEEDNDAFVIYVKDEREYCGSVQAKLTMMRPAEFQTLSNLAVSELSMHNGVMVLKQEFKEDGYYCASAVAVWAEGGKSVLRMNDERGGREPAGSPYREVKVLGQSQETQMRLCMEPGIREFTLYAVSAATFDEKEDITESVLKKARHTSEEGRQAMWERHTARWREYWEKSYVRLESEDRLAEKIEMHYTYFFYLMESASKGKYPPNFGGMIFSPCGDYRHWGTMQWWNNLSLYYNPILASGHYELMKPLFSMYGGMEKAARTAARQQWGAEGMYLPEVTWFNGPEELPEEIAAGSTRSWRRLFTSTAGKMCIQTHRLKTQRSCGNWPDCLAKISCCLQPIIPSTGSHSLLQPVKRLLRTILFLRTRCFTEMQRSCFICEERRM